MSDVLYTTLDGFIARPTVSPAPRTTSSYRPRGLDRTYIEDVSIFNRLKVKTTTPTTSIEGIVGSQASSNPVTPYVNSAQSAKTLIEPSTYSKPRIKSHFRPGYLFKKRSKKQLVLITFALAIFLSGSYITYTTWLTDRSMKATINHLTDQANKAVATGTGSTNNANPAIATVKPTPKVVAAYAVAPNYPKYLKIPAIGVDAEVGQVGLLASGALGTPDNVYYTDWYTGSAEPGAPGATLIDGHVSSWTADGVFYNLHKLVAGDSMQIVKGDNTVVNYQVVKTEVYSANNVDMQAAITPIDPTVSGLNLITCTGDVIKGTSTFNERVIVFAKEVN